VNPSEHIGDFAALYALGTLDERERQAVERHLAACAACALLLEQAQDDVATLAAAGPAYRPRTEFTPARLRAPQAPQALQTPRRGGWPAWAALAAAFVAGSLPSAYLWQQNRAMHVAMSNRSDAVERLAAAPVRSTAFKATGGEMTGQVMYPADGSWYVVLVRGASKALEVAWMHDGQQTMLGTAQPYGDVAMLYLPKSHRMNQLALLDGTRVVAQAQLAY
jgi:anti-sigma factor RsiW